ncbi:hypothetical protein B0H16DRAFT_1483375 [Mycena metata]|uniref:Uncharacterized protein n=1 Tax=Mycena metata TaxID=1033252 RepID=A0AAD7DZ61_9AGAR|nr:hypothetical protein B0H16DRAFT_1483375 [Mycena metata]
MPSLPSSAPSAPVFSPSAVFGVLAFILTVIGVSCLYLAALHLSDKMAARARTTDVESRKTVAAAALVAARKNLPIVYLHLFHLDTSNLLFCQPTADKPKARIVVNFVKILAGNFGVPRPKNPKISPVARFCSAINVFFQLRVNTGQLKQCEPKNLDLAFWPAPPVFVRFGPRLLSGVLRRRTLHGISPLRVVLACGAAMAPVPLPRLQHTRIYSVDKIERASIISPIIPIASVLKPSARHALLRQLDESSVDPTRYIMRRSHPRPGPSHLRIAHPTTPPSRIVECPSILGASQLGNVPRSVRVKQPAAKQPKRSPAFTPAKRRATPNKENGRRRMLV